MYISYFRLIFNIERRASLYFTIIIHAIYSMPLKLPFNIARY